MKEAVKITNPLSVLPLLRKWRKQKQENFLTVTLNGAHEVIKVHHVSKGLVNRTIVHPRECFHPAVKDFATSVIFVHNHPSGSTTASGEDDDITNRMSMAEKIMGIHLLDHIIITPMDDFYSYRQVGKLPDEHYTYELDAFVQSLEKDCGTKNYQGENNEQS